MTPEERALVGTHTVIGEEMLDKIGAALGKVDGALDKVDGALDKVGRLVHSCHERYDGGGYPDGLAGEQIPLVARIVCCCDAYNAITTDRPYRAGRSAEEAMAELRRCAGSHLDPDVVDALARSSS
ncbi:MAG: HD domain-containing phosphohydrolase [Gaiellaceae bacterium]